MKMQLGSDVLFNLKIRYEPSIAGGHYCWGESKN